MEEKELWMNKLKEKLADYSEPAPASGWEQLEKELMPPVERKIYPYRKWMMALLMTPAADEIRHIQTPALASTPDALPGVQQPDMQGTAVEPVLRPVTREDRLAKVDRNHTEQKTGVDPLGIGNENKLSTGNGEDSLSEEDKNVKGNGETENVKDESKQAENTDVSQGQSQDTERSNNRPRRPSGKDKLHIPTVKNVSEDMMAEIRECVHARTQWLYFF